MKTRQFLTFVGPSLAMMILFIALPLVSVFSQSFYQERTLFETRDVETCSPFTGCVTKSETLPITDENGRSITQTVYVGATNYTNVIQPEALSKALEKDGGGISAILTIDFWKALRFTLTFTLLTLPLVVGVGLMIAFAVNAAIKSLKGPIIFISLLPFIITPVIGSLSIYWLFVGDGILTTGLESLLQRDLALFAQGWTIELLMMFYRVWHVAPFAFVVFYAALQTINQDALEAAIVDGASRFQRIRYVVLPHLMPLIIFVALIHLMDCYRVFEEIIGFRAEAYRISLQWMTFDLLTPDDSGNRSIGRASASSMLTMIGITILLIPLIIRTWRDQRSQS